MRCSSCLCCLGVLPHRLQTGEVMFPHSGLLYIVVNQTREKVQQLLHGFLHFCDWHWVSQGGVVPAGCNNFLLSHWDEKHEIAGTARADLHSLCQCGVSSCSVHRTHVKETRLKANLPPTPRESKCRAPGCEPLSVWWNGRYRFRFEFPVASCYPDGCPVLRGKVNLPHQMQRSTTVDNVPPVLRLFLLS